MDSCIVIPESGDAATRLDVYLAEELGRTRSAVNKLIQSCAVTVNGNPEKSGYRIKCGDRIVVTAKEETTDIVPENIPLDLLYEDDAIIVVNKARGMTVHPGGGCYTGTLANALIYRFPMLRNSPFGARSGIVHRLDKDTTGVMVAAKTESAQVALSKQFAERTTSKIYLAVLEGNLKPDSGAVKTLIGRDPKNRKLMRVVNKDGREAVTQYAVLERYAENCYVEFKILTGRTHQIRVHAKHLGHPVVGDAQYGYKKQKFNLDGQLLHARSLTFRHPDTGETLTFTAPLPEDFIKVLGILQKNPKQ